MIICPYLKDPDVAREFNELKEATSEKAAYAIWSLNNGNAIDKAPNGADSILFKTLLNHFDGDRAAAIKAKSKVYSKNFLNWFGDWINDPKNASKVVDENGEPLVVYHGTTSDFAIFSKEKLGTFTDAKSAKLAFFTASNEELARDIYAQMESNEHLYQRLLKVDPNFTKEDVGIGPEEDSIIDRIYREWSEYYNNLELEYKDVLQELEKHRTTHKQTFSKTISKAEEWVTDLGLEDYIKEGYIISDTQRKEYEDGKTITISREVDVVDKLNITEDAKVLNTKRSREFAEKYETLDRELKEALEKAEIEEKQSYRNKVKALFLNIRNPKVDSDYGNHYRVETYAKRIQDAINNSNDGGVIKDTRDPYRTDVYYFFEPNQAKSAIDNNGAFSQKNNNIYYNLKSKSPTNTVEVISFLEDILRDYFGFHRYHFGLYARSEGFNRQETERSIEYVRQLFDLPKNTIKLDKFNERRVLIDGDFIADNLDSFIDKISHSNVKDVATKIKLVKFLKEKFPQIKGIVWVNGTGWNGMFKDGIVYLNKNASLDIAAEECLHPFVEAIYHENPALFNKLLKEAKAEFKQLVAEIPKTYSNEKGFSREDRRKELVTQALSRHFSDVFEDETGIRKPKQKSIWKQAWDWIIEKLGLSGVRELGANITLRQLAEAIFDANNINISDTYFEGQMFNLSEQNQEGIPESTQTNDISNSITRQIYEIGESINNERQLYINSVENQFKKDNPNYTQEELAKVRNSARHDFNREKISSLTEQKQRVLAEAHGMVLNRFGFFESTKEGQYKYLLELFVNSLQESTFNAYRIENMGRKKYEQVGMPETAGSVANVLYTAIYDGDLTTLDKSLARDYVRLFWGSDLIQSALDVINAPGKTSQQLENELVDHMTKDPVSSRNTSIIDWFKDIWDKLNLLVKTVFDVHSFTEEQKNNILKAVEAAFMVSQDLVYTQNNKLIYDRYDGKFDSSDILSNKDKEVLSSIKSGTKTRLKSHLSRHIKNTKLIADLKSRLEILEEKSEDSIDDIFNTIEDFLKTANTEIGKTRYYIDKTLSPNMDEWDPQQINFIQQDLIGYYRNILQNISELFGDNTSAISKANEIRYNNNKDAINLKNLSTTLLKTIDELQRDYNESIVKPYVKKILTDYVNNDTHITDKKLFIYNMEKWLEQDSTYGDLSAGEVLVGMASRSKSPVVRIVENMISRAEFKTNRDVLARGNKLMRLYNKIRPVGSQISPFNYQKRFMEFDERGISTGYFIREINYGLFYRKKDLYEEELRAEFGLTADEDGNTIFPDEDFVDPNSVYNKYYDKLDEWLDKNCERRYKLEYYKAKRRHLSPKTLRALNQIQRQIDLLVEKAVDEFGYINMSLLTQNEKLQLDHYRKEKRNLGVHYIFTEDSQGILHVEEKSGEALKMANEISSWNSYISNKVKYKPDWDKFNKAKQIIVDKYGENSQEVLSFVKNNTVQKLTEDFYNLLRLVSHSNNQMPKEFEDLKKRRSEIINALKFRTGAGSHNLNKLGLGLNTDTSGWKELQRIEQRLADIKKEVISSVSSKQENDKDSLTFDDIAKMMYVTVSDSTKKPFLTELIDQWRNATSTNTNLGNVFNELFTYTDEHGKIRYLKAFKYLSPINWTVKVDGKTIKCIESLPGNEYSELDDSSPFVNENFKKDGPSMQPKLYDNKGDILYKNPEYDKLTADERDFLNELLKTMSDAYEMIPKKSLGRDHLLPQVSGRTASVIANSIRGRELGTALGYGFRKLTTAYAETEDDVSTNVDLSRRPDGTVVNNIPVRFVEKLKNPAAQTTDVLGSVILFYDMAVNYKNKSNILPQLELTKYAINPEYSSNKNRMEDQYEKIENILDQRVYGKETTFGFKTNEKITKNKQAWIQRGKLMRNAASVAMLGVNFTTITVGYVDALCSLIADAVGGKYITTSEVRDAFGVCIAHLPKVLNGLGNPVVNDKIVAAMQYNQLSRSNSEIFSDTDKFKVGKFIHQHLLMGGYTLTDYLINGLMLVTTYKHYKLLKDPRTNKEKFFSKSEAINVYTKLGYTEKQAITVWKKSKTTLWDAYEQKDGLFVLTKEHKDHLFKWTEDEIAGRLRDRTAMYNGVIPTSERAKLQQNVWGSYISLMRNFYINTYWDRFKTGGDYITEDGDHHITWRSEYKRDDLGLENLETGEFEGATFKDFCRGISKLISNTKYVFMSGQVNKLTKEQKYALKRHTVELIQIAALMLGMFWSIGYARGGDDSDEDKTPAWNITLVGDGPVLSVNPRNVDKKFLNWARHEIALLFTRGFTERITPWWPPTIMELINSPSTATSFFDKLGSAFDIFGALISQNQDDVIKYGGYRHMTKGTSAILKMLSPLGVDNFVRGTSISGVKSTLNYYIGLAPTKYMVETKEEWNEKHKRGSHGAKRKKSRNKQNSEFVE